MSPRLVTEERGAREDEGGEVLCHALCMQALRAVIGARHMTEAWESASQWGRLKTVAGLRGFAGFPPPPNALARPPRRGGHGGRPPGTNPAKGRKPAHAVPRSPLYWPW